MANIRPNQLPPATTITNNDRLIIDQGAAGVNAAPPKSLLDTFAPVATQSEAEAGTDNVKRMTPLRAQQHLLAQGVPNTRSIVAGDGLTGGGTLDSNLELALSSTSLASLALADSAVQSVNGKTGSSVTLTKSDVGLGNVDNTSDAAKPISTATQTALNAKANSSVTITAGVGLTGGGNLTANRTVALDAASIASLGKADTALQAPGGVSGQVLVKQSAADNDVSWENVAAATAVSYGPQTLTPEQQEQARQNIQADHAYDTIADITSATVPAYANAIRTNGYYAAGDGGAALYKRVSSEPSHAGKVMSADGAWWELAERVVNYAMFGADLTGATPSDAAMFDCHDYANKVGAEVVQKWGVVLWRNVEIPVKTDCDLSGLTVKLDGLSGTTAPVYSSPICYSIDPSAPQISLSSAEIQSLMDNHAGELVARSTRVTHPAFVNNPFSVIIIETDAMDIQRILPDGINYQPQYRKDIVVTSRDGNLVIGFDRTVNTQIKSVLIYPYEDNRLTFKSPLFLSDGAPSFRAVRNRRNQAKIIGFNFKEVGTPPTNIRSLLTISRCFDTSVEGIFTPAQSASAYGIIMELVAGVKIKNAWGFGGYGVTGANWAKVVSFEDCTLNRIDGHWACFDFDISRCRLINDNIIISGGGYLRVSDCVWRITAPSGQNGGDVFRGDFIVSRSDYGSEFNGNVEVNNLRIELGDTVTIAAISVVRNGTSMSYDPGRDVHTMKKISLKNVTLVTPVNIGTGNLPADRFTLFGVWLDAECTHANARRVYWPTDINIDGINVLSSQQNSNPGVFIRALISTRFAHESVYVQELADDSGSRFGTNCRISIKNVSQPWVSDNPVLSSANRFYGVVSLIGNVSGRAARYGNSDSWRPSISVYDCNKSIIDFHADGVLKMVGGELYTLSTFNGGQAQVLTTLSGTLVKPKDTGIGTVSFNLNLGSPVLFNNCPFFIPLDKTGVFSTAVSLNAAKGSGNYLADGAVAGTHYTSPPAGFFV